MSFTCVLHAISLDALFSALLFVLRKLPDLLLFPRPSFRLTLVYLPSAPFPLCSFLCLILLSVLVYCSPAFPFLVLQSGRFPSHHVLYLQLVPLTPSPFPRYPSFPCPSQCHHPVLISLASLFSLSFACPRVHLLDVLGKAERGDRRL